MVLPGTGCGLQDRLELRDLPASASWVLGVKECIMISGSALIVLTIEISPSPVALIYRSKWIYFSMPIASQSPQ